MSPRIIPSACFLTALVLMAIGKDELSMLSIGFAIYFLLDEILKKLYEKDE
jgi:hypothetical protein